MSGILIIVYEELHELTGRKNEAGISESKLTKYVCRRGITNESQINSPKIVLLYGKMHQNLSKTNNHYSTVIRDATYFEAITHRFTLSYLLEERASDELPRREWPKSEKDPGKRKQAPEHFLTEIKYDNYTAYELDSVNGLKVYSILPRATWHDCFYSNKGGKLNEELDPIQRVNYINFLDKNRDCPNFTTSWSNNWTKKGGKTIGLSNLIQQIPKNVCFSSNITTPTINERYEIWLDLRKKIPHAICYTCSGRVYVELH